MEKHQKVTVNTDKIQELECAAYYDWKTDSVYIKVRRVVKTEDGHLVKKGIAFRVTEEMLKTIAEGFEYPVGNLDRWEAIIEEVDSEGTK